MINFQGSVTTILKSYLQDLLLTQVCQCTFISLPDSFAGNLGVSASNLTIECIECLDLRHSLLGQAEQYGGMFDRTDRRRGIRSECLKNRTEWANENLDKRDCIESEQSSFLFQVGDRKS